MGRLTGIDPTEVPDWEAMYRRGTPPWDTGNPSGELVKLHKEGAISPCCVLELGCGTGADAAYLARQGFEVTAIDSSPIAVERARSRAEMEDVLVRFVLADAFEFAQTAEQFDLVYDAGLYHFIRQRELDRYLDVLWRVTCPGSLYLTLAGSSSEKAEGGPPQVSKDQIHHELGRLFEVVHLRRFRFESPRRKRGYLGWSCLMRRPIVHG